MGVMPYNYGEWTRRGGVGGRGSWEAGEAGRFITYHILERLPLPKKKLYSETEKSVAVVGYIKIPPVKSKELIRAARLGNGTEYFQNFHFGDLIVWGQPRVAYQEGIRILNECRNADLPAFNTIHKGGIYYWIGASAFILRDYQTAVFFMDAAVSEDIRGDFDPTPARYFLLVDGDAAEQAARPLVQDTQAKIKNLISTYNNWTGSLSTLPNIQSLRDRFLKPAMTKEHKSWRSLTSTLISFILEWNDLNEFLDIRVNEGTAEPLYVHLFKGCVLFESLLRANPLNSPPRRDSKNRPLTLINVLQYLQKELSIPNDLKIGESDFPTILDDLHELNPDDKRLTTAIEFTGKVRNSIGHNLGWDLQLTKIDYQRLFTMITLSNLHAIACLYPNT
jgi:hypothetical protein